MVLARLAETLTQSAEGISDRVTGALFEPVIRLGVTGLSRSGKTVFITSLIANLMDRGRMNQLSGVASGAITAAFLQPQPNDTVPRFDFETHLAALSGADPHWPTSTRRVSELRLSSRVQPSGILGAISGPRTVHLDIVDYPGEWLLDLALLDKDFATWSAETLARAEGREMAGPFLKKLAEIDASEKLDESAAQSISKVFTQYLNALRAAGFSDCTPGRFIMPGDLEGSPALTFAPMSAVERPKRRSLWREMERRFEAYKSKVVKPFFTTHFAGIDRQIVLVDVLGAIHDGPQAVEDLRATMADILGAFKTGKNGWLSSIMGKKVEKILFAATKADHIHHKQHANLNGIMDALVNDARRRADFSGAKTQSMSLASLRSTIEETHKHEGTPLDMVRGRLLDTDKEAAFYPGALPDDPHELLEPATSGATKWLNDDYQVMRFAPPDAKRRAGDGPAHIRLDQAAEFLFGDKLR